MPVLELRHGWCEQCGHDMTLVVYWPYVVMLRRLTEAGGLHGFDNDDLDALFADAMAVDEFDQDIDGELDVTVRTMLDLVGNAVFVDIRKESIVCCPRCKALVGVVSRERVG